MGRESASSGSKQCERYRVEQHFDHLVLSERCGRHQRRPAVVVKLVHLGASPDQQPHALCMVVQGRYMHGRHSVLATPIDVVLVLLQERLQLGNITFACCFEEQDASTCTCEAQAVIDAAVTVLDGGGGWGGLTASEREEQQPRRCARAGRHAGAPGAGRKWTGQFVWCEQNNDSSSS